MSIDKTDRAATPADSDDERLSEYKIQIGKDYGVTFLQREHANEDMRFVNVAGGMWEGWHDDNQNPDRVRLELDLTGDFLHRFLGEWIDSRTGVEFKPEDAETGDEDAEMLNGIYRNDFRDNSGAIATDVAVEEAATCGYGAFKLATVFVDEDDPENEDMRIEWRPVHNAYNTVIWDQSSTRIDKRDARWVHVLFPFTRDSFEEQFPGQTAVSAFVPERNRFLNLEASQPDLIYVAERYEVVTEPEEVHVYRNLETRKIEVYSDEDHELISDELAANEFREKIRTRTINRRRVEKRVFSGEAFLKPMTRVAGKFLPIIPFYGIRQYIDGSEWSRGLVRKLKDPQRLFNMQTSQLAENAASAGQEVPIFDREQVEAADVQSAWADKNNKPYLYIDRMTDGEGNLIASGPIGYSKPQQLDGNVSALMSIVPDFVNATTGGAPQDTLDPDMSGKAIRALMKRENLKTRVVSKNIQDAIVWSGEVYQSMAAEVYNTPRIMRTLGKDGQEGTVRMFETVMDEQTGRLVEANTLRGKKFKAYPDIGPAYETQREQTVEEIKGMLEALGDTQAGQKYNDALVAVMIANISGVGMDPIKEMNRRIMVAEGWVKPETPEEEAIVQQVQAQQQQSGAQEQLLLSIAQKEQAEARSLDASSIQKVADAEKKQAETQEILSEISRDDLEMAVKIAQMIRESQSPINTLERLPLN